MHDLAQRIQSMRAHLGYTQAEIAARVKVKYRSWQDYESGKSIPGGKALNGIASLGINTNWLLTGTGPMWMNSGDQMAALGLLEVVADAMGEIMIELHETCTTEVNDGIANAFAKLYRRLSRRPDPSTIELITGNKRT